MALYLTGYYGAFAARCISRNSVLSSAVEIQAIAPPYAGKLDWTTVRLSDLRNQPGVVAACAYIQNQVEVWAGFPAAGFQSLMVESGARNDPRWGGVILDGKTALLSRGQYEKLAGSDSADPEPRIVLRVRRVGVNGEEEVRHVTLDVAGFVDAVGTERIVVPEGVARAIEEFLSGGPAIALLPALPKPGAPASPLKEVGAARARIVAGECESAERLILSLERQGYSVEHALGKIREARARSGLVTASWAAAVVIILLLSTGAVFMPVLTIARSREYESALLRSLGATASDVLSIFTFEGSAIGVAGGIGTVFAAWAATTAVNPIVRVVASGIEPASFFSWELAWLHVAVITTTLMLPLAAMLLPARRNPDVATLLRAGANA